MDLTTIYPFDHRRHPIAELLLLREIALEPISRDVIS